MRGNVTSPARAGAHTRPSALSKDSSRLQGGHRDAHREALGSDRSLVMERTQLNASGLLNSTTLVEQNIRVAARIRPRTQRETAAGISVHVNEAGVAEGEWPTELIVSSSNASQAKMKFRFDAVFPDTASQEAVFEEMAAPLVRSVVSGYNAALFAYGQTGTGKTHTMLGEDIWVLSVKGTGDQLSPKQRDALENGEVRGVIPRAMKLLFLLLKDRPHKVAVSYLEIYNEKILDLLAPTQTGNGLELREDKQGNVQVCEATVKRVSSVHEVFDQLWRGAKNRAVSSTDMNEHSSRSHTIFQVLVETKGTATQPGTKAKLNLVDLAGSEKWRPHQLSEFSDQRIAEMTSINQSLSNLGNCVRGLLRPGRSHIPFRNSKLTRLLQDSLGGSAQCGFVVTASPSELAHEETISTLQFADRVKRVQVKSELNAIETPEFTVKRLEAELNKMREENRDLKSRISQAHHPSDDDGASSDRSFNNNGENEWTGNNQQPQAALPVGTLLSKCMATAGSSSSLAQTTLGDPKALLRDYLSHLQQRRSDQLKPKERIALLEWALASQAGHVEAASASYEMRVRELEAKVGELESAKAALETELSRKTQELTGRVQTTVEEKLRLQQEVIDLKQQMLTLSSQQPKNRASFSLVAAASPPPPPPPLLPAAPSSASAPNGKTVTTYKRTLVAEKATANGNEPSSSSRPSVSIANASSSKASTVQIQRDGDARSGVRPNPSSSASRRPLVGENASFLVQESESKPQMGHLARPIMTPAVRTSASEQTNPNRRVSMSEDLLRIESRSSSGSIASNRPVLQVHMTSDDLLGNQENHRRPSSSQRTVFNSSRSSFSVSKPSSEAPGSSSKASSSSSSSSSVQVWDRFVDEKTGRAYYYCKGTGETTWRRPSASGAMNIVVRGE